MIGNVNYTQIRGNLKAIRINNGFSQARVAQELHITQNAYSKQELGYTKIDLGTLILIAKAFSLEFRKFMDMLLGDPIALQRTRVLHDKTRRK